MRISDFNYNLPETSIAQFPPEQRGTTRLLVLNRKTGTITHKHYPELLNYVRAGDVVVLNDTKVIKARLQAKNQYGKARELLLLESHTKAQTVHAHQVLYKGKLHEKEVLDLRGTPLIVERLLSGGVADISSKVDLLELTEQFGSVPLPPYMKRSATAEDTQRYQTEFALRAGSVAAPTASLNFTNDLRNKLEAKGAKIAYLTLHVGLGTFLPIRSDTIEEHVMHSEYFEIPGSTIITIRQAKQQGRKIFAVGTTVTRTLEYAAQSLLNDTMHDIRGEANIFIYPGYTFKIVDALVTNFHAPKSTVLMMAAAFAGWKNLKHSYEIALQEQYQFLSYGDSMLIL